MKLKNCIVSLLCLFLLFSVVSCSASAGSSVGDMAEGGAAQKEMATESEAPAAAKLPENRKLIQTVRMIVETEDMTPVLTEIHDRVAALGGYVESSNVQNGSSYNSKRQRYASLTLRVPADKLTELTDKVGEVTNVVSSEKTVEDVTLNYVATESRMKALQTEESRLLELMAKAETMADLLTVEKRLTEVRAQLEEVTSALRLYENQVDFATVHLTVEEVKEYTDTAEEKTLWQEIRDGFADSVENVGVIFRELFVFLIVALPYLSPLAIGGAIALVCLLIRRRKRNKNDDRHTPPRP